jgi:uncharacterized protein YcfJ
MTFKKTAIALITIALMSGCASAGRYHDDAEYYNTSSVNHFTAKAKVIRVEPVYDSITVNQPETRCWNEEVRQHGHKSSTPVIAGAILGGVVGNQFGGGSGKDVMTVAGAILGGSIGNDIRHSQPARGHVRMEQHCETVDNYHEVNELVGYNVKYRYNGNDFWTRTSSDPGKYIRVSVSVSPLD